MKQTCDKFQSKAEKEEIKLAQIYDSYCLCNSPTHLEKDRMRKKYYNSAGEKKIDDQIM